MAYDWDDAGRNAIRSIARQIGKESSKTYLGGMQGGKDPADHLKNAVNAIDGFSLAHLLAGAEKAQALTDKPVHFESITCGKPQERRVQFSPLSNALESLPSLPPEKPKEYLYSANQLLPMLTHDHGNKTLLEAKIAALVNILDSKPQRSDEEQIFKLPSNFIEEKRFAVLGPALILWLKIAIEQQLRERMVKITYSILAQELKTSRRTITKYKTWLKKAGYLKILTGGKVQKLSVKYFVK